MAIYHLHVKVIGRKAGSSAVASAAYRSASRLRDDRLERSHDFSNKRGVVHSEVMLPEDAPEQWSDRERLWNDVEAFEVRKDAQLAREVEFALPREMTQAQGIELARDFVQAEFVDQGMIADLNVHWDMAEDGMPKPHAHVMLTMRSVDENGFGPKGAGLEPHRDGRALAGTLGRACQRAPGRTRHRRAHRPSQPGGAGHRAGAAKPDRRARAAHRGRRDRGRRPRGNAPRDRAQQRRADHRRSFRRAGRDHAPAIDLHAARHGDVRAPAQRRDRAVQRGHGRDARARPIWSNSARTDAARTASPPAR